jgi:hypothetical protein
MKPGPGFPAQYPMARPVIGPEPTGPVLSPLGILFTSFLCKFVFTFFAYAQKLDVVILNYEIVFFGQSFFRLFYESQFFVQEFTVINDLPTFGTYKMVVMLLFFLRFELVSTLSVTDGKSGNNTHSGQQAKRSVDSAQTHTRVRSVEGSVYFFGAHVL